MLQRLNLDSNCYMEWKHRGKIILTSQIFLFFLHFYDTMELLTLTAKT